ncbi:AraC family ligand binding domain-containing protein [Paenibacillus sp. GCM10023252]|uniref:AraC family transcriptional regulator n=1 Tax=Paenibacillus sp. GCM10023252 TaxID=3252649 RepID=UPI003608B167
MTKLPAFPAPPTTARSTDLTLLYWGKEACEPGHSFGPGVRERYKIHFIHQGKGIVRTANHTYTPTAGQAFLIYPHTLTFYQADLLEPWTYSWIAFDGSRVPEILGRTILSPDHPILPMDLELMPTLYEQLSRTKRYDATGDLQQMALLYELLSRIVQMMPSHPEEPSSVIKIDRYIRQAEEYIATHYAEQLTVQQLASIVGLDRKYFSALFKQSTGIPPQAYLIQYRMRKACNLLATGHYSVEEVARSVGYSDGLLFSKMFKRTTGLSPTQYRSGKMNTDIMP